VISAKSNRLDPITHDRAKDKWRNLVERLFNKLKNWRRVATRYDKTKESCPGFVAIASIKLWIPFVHDNLDFNRRAVAAAGLRAGRSAPGGCFCYSGGP